MMYWFSLFLLALLVVGETHSFSNRPKFALATRHRVGPRAASSMRYREEQALSEEVNQDDDSLWRRYLQSDEIQQVRQELVQKYLAWGKPKAVAEVEVDDFLYDKTQAEPFLEMRHQAHEELADGDLDPFLWFQLIGGFLVGFLVSAIPKYYDLYKASFPDTSGPIPFL